jgi:hypothetical protein
MFGVVSKQAAQMMADAEEVLAKQFEEEIQAKMKSGVGP